MPNPNESLDVSAKTIDEAIAQGLNRLGLTRDQVDIEIINEGKRGIFGLGSEEAVVRLTPKTQSTPDLPAAETPSEVDDNTVATEFDEFDDEEDEEFSLEGAAQTQLQPTDQLRQTSSDKEVATIAAKHLDGLLQRMGIKAKITTRIGQDLVEPGEKAPLVLDITGQDLGILIGRRSETLQALQYMVRLMVSKEVGRWQQVVVDVESYRSRRRRSLEQMAHRMAERAVASRERVVMEAMSAYERRIIHVALRDHPAVFTKSIGRDNNRKVTIIPK